MVEVLVEKLRSSTASLVTDSLTCNTDICEAAACALANLLSLHAPNATKMINMGGLEVLFQILNSCSSVDLLDADQATLIQANVANALANTIAILGENRLRLAQGIATLSVNIRERAQILLPRSIPHYIVVLCAASLSAARRAASLLLGNLACNSELRNELGELGAVEALWSVSRNHQNSAERTTALWALSNLTWCNSANQFLIPICLWNQLMATMR